ncbi:GNAT family N-acetyltransferase [bacterium]|nr:GNAT family N-acetyltransferase [bacterium]
MPRSAVSESLPVSLMESVTTDERPAETSRADSPTSATWRWYSSQDRSQVLSRWEQVEKQHGALPLLASRAWTETWLDHYGDLVPHRYGVLEVAGRCVGVMLLTRGVDDRDGLFRERTWHCGTAGEPSADSVFIEYNNFACLPEFLGSFVQTMLSQLMQESDWDALKFDGFPEEQLPDVIRQGTDWTLHQKSARWFDLNKAREAQHEVLLNLGDSTRKNIRQNIRKLGDVQFEWAETAEHAQDIFTDLVRLHQARWQSVGQPGCYSSERFTQFHRALIDRLVPRGEMVLSRLSSGQEVLGCSQLLIDQGRVMVYQGGRVANSAASPGLITDFFSMQESLRRGYDAFDFMAGDSIHKQRLTNRVTTLTWAQWRRPRWKYRVMSGIREFRRQLASRGQQTLDQTEAEPATIPAVH